MEVNKASSCCCSDNSHSRCGKGVVAGAYIYFFKLQAKSSVVSERQLAKLSVLPRENANTEISAVRKQKGTTGEILFSLPPPMSF